MSRLGSFSMQTLRACGMNVWPTGLFACPWAFEVGRNVCFDATVMIVVVAFDCDFAGKSGCTTARVLLFACGRSLHDVSRHCRGASFLYRSFSELSRGVVMMIFLMIYVLLTHVLRYLHLIDVWLRASNGCSASFMSSSVAYRQLG